MTGKKGEIQLTGLDCEQYRAKQRIGYMCAPESKKLSILVVALLCRLLPTVCKNLFFFEGSVVGIIPPCFFFDYCVEPPCPSFKVQLYSCCTPVHRS